MNFKQQLREKLGNRLIEVNTDLGVFYVRRLSVREMNELIAREEALGESQQQGADDAKFALRVLDKNGNQVFDENDKADLALIQELPFNVRTSIDNAFFRTNFGGMEKND